MRTQEDIKEISEYMKAFEKEYKEWKVAYLQRGIPLKHFKNGVKEELKRLIYKLKNLEQ